MAVLWAWGLARLLAFMPSFLMLPGNGPYLKVRPQEPVKSNKHSLGEDWCLCPCFRWICGSSVYWKPLFAGILKLRSLRDASFPSLLCMPALQVWDKEERGDPLHLQTKVKHLVALRLQGASFVSPRGIFIAHQQLKNSQQKETYLQEIRPFFYVLLSKLWIVHFACYTWGKPVDWTPNMLKMK